MTLGDGPGVEVSLNIHPVDIPKGWQLGSWRSHLNRIHPFPYSSPPQTLLDMVENYPTALRSLVLAENSISPELQQQICDLLSEGEEEEEEVAGGPGDTQERERAREPAAHQRGSSSWTGPSGKSPQWLIGGLRPIRRGMENLGHFCLWSPEEGCMVV